MHKEWTMTDQLIEPVRQQDDSASYTATENPPVRRPVNSWLPDVFSQLQAIKYLPNGWDSHGAPSPKTNWVGAGWGLLVWLCGYADLPKPHVNPTRNGGVQFEWEAEDRYFELEVMAERAATYLYCDDSAGIEETGTVFEDDPPKLVLNYIHRMETPQ